MMASYWPTPMARNNDPVVADAMNAMTKIVFSTTLGETTWANTRVFAHDIEGNVRHLKQESDEQITILGSGTIVAQLAQAGLIDAYQIVINPIVLGGGRTLFEAVPERIDMKLTGSRTFRNGNVLLDYVPAR
jgi:dihydrofolate reductase